MPPKIEFLKIRDFGEIITDTFGFIRENFKPLLKCFFIFCGFFLIGSAIFSALQQIKTVGTINNIRLGHPNSIFGQGGRNPFAIFGVEYLMIFIFELFVFTAAHVTVISYIGLYKQKGNIVPEPNEVWAYFKHFFIKTALSTILLFIMLCISAIFCFVPFFYLAPIFALIFPVMIIENTSFGYAFNRSFKLAHKNYWTVFGAMFIMVLIVYVGSLVVLLPVSALNISTIFLHFGKGTSMSITLAVVAGLLQQVVRIIFILPVITSCLCYFSLSEEIEGNGLMGRIEQLGATTPEDNSPTEEF